MRELGFSEKHQIKFRACLEICSTPAPDEEKRKKLKCLHADFGRTCEA